MMSLHEGLSADKPALVLDLGARYTKFGFVGEYSPRCIFPSEIKCPVKGKIRKIYSYENEQDLYSLLVEFVHTLYFKYVLVSPKDRHVVVVESLLSPTIFRDTLAKVLYQHFEVASILFVPSHLVVLCSLGLKTGLVIDVGHQEVQIIPVYEGVPILSAWQAQPLAGQAVEERLRKNFYSAYLNVKNKFIDVPFSEAERISEDIKKLSDSIIEDIKVRGCFVTTMERARDLEEGVEIQEPPPMPYRLIGESLVIVPGWVRETAYEVLFEQDNDMISLQNLVLDCILKCPIDTRRALLENLVVVGGTAIAPGFKGRLLEEVRSLLKSPSYFHDISLKKVKLHTLPAKENYACWLGGAIFGATDMILMRALTRENYSSLQTVPDWSNLAHNALMISKLTI